MQRLTDLQTGDVVFQVTPRGSGSDGPGRADPDGTGGAAGNFNRHNNTLMASFKVAWSMLVLRAH